MAGEGGGGVEGGRGVYRGVAGGGRGSEEPQREFNYTHLCKPQNPP